MSDVKISTHLEIIIANMEPGQTLSVPEVMEKVRELRGTAWYGPIRAMFRIWATDDLHSIEVAPNGSVTKLLDIALKD